MAGREEAGAGENFVETPAKRPSRNIWRILGGAPSGIKRVAKTADVVPGEQCDKAGLTASRIDVVGTLDRCPRIDRPGYHSAAPAHGRADKLS